MKQILCQKRIQAGICPISRKFKEKEDYHPLSQEAPPSFLGNNLELLGKVIPLLGFVREEAEFGKVYLNCADCSSNCPN
jgi:hypothetical protein